MTHGSLFSGIGGFDLAAEWMGWENKFHCEWNEFGQRVLKHYWPKAESYDDITKTDFTIHRGRIDIITGGFPCQPYSQAGKRLGKEDDRHLWPEMLRAIREIQPCWVVGENVRGLISWNEGMVFDEVQTNLEAEGYEVLPFLLPACAVNAPHRRDRVWFVAHRKNIRCRESEKTNQRTERVKERGKVWDSSNTDGAGGFVAHSNGTIKKDGRRENLEKEGTVRRDEEGDVSRELSSVGATPDTNGTSKQSEHIRRQKERKPIGQNSGEVQSTWQDFPTQSPICNGDDGLSSRLDGITFPKWRNESIKAGGNAIVPQVAHQIFKAIQEYDLRKQ